MSLSLVGSPIPKNTKVQFLGHKVQYNGKSSATAAHLTKEGQQITHMHSPPLHRVTGLKEMGALRLRDALVTSRFRCLLFYLNLLRDHQS